MKTTLVNIKLNKDRWVTGPLNEVGGSDNTRKFFALVRMSVPMRNNYSLRIK